jgi:2-C-methyl-D-erythritol 4-phosphate cytidylyltransferase
MIDRYIVLVAGGSGTRMGTAVPKQFLPLGKSVVLMQTFMAFYHFSPDFKFILALPENQIEYWKELCETYHFDLPHEIVKGGEQRFHSVQNALERVGESGLVAIHDGVRPLVSADTISRCFAEAEKSGNAIPCLKVVESLRETGEGWSRAVDRSKFVSIQTPQVFRCELLKRAYRQPFEPFYTDDASVVENLGVKINLVEGNVENIKITSPMDLVVAEGVGKGLR